MSNEILGNSDFFQCAEELRVLMRRLPDEAYGLNMISGFFLEASYVHGEVPRIIPKARPRKFASAQLDEKPAKSKTSWLAFKNDFEPVAKKFLRFVAASNDIEITPLDKLLAQWDNINYEQALKIIQESQAFVEAAIRAIESRKIDKSIPPPQPNLPDGPNPPSSFRWQGKTIDMQPTPWKLLNCLWTKNRITVSELENDVWGNDTGNDGRLKSAINRVSNALSSSGCSKQVHKQGEWVTLD